MKPNPMATRTRTRRVMLAIGVPLSLVLLVLAITAWSIAGRPASATQGLVGQMQMLLAVFQGLLGLSVALSTIYYAIRTGEMVETMNASNQRDLLNEERAATERLTGATIDLAGACATIGPLMRRDWRWRLPWVRDERMSLLQPAYTQAANHLAEVTKASENLRTIRPGAEGEIAHVLKVANSVFTLAFKGDEARLSESVAKLKVELQALQGSV